MELYKELSLVKREIRLLRVKPGIATDRLDCEFLVRPLEEAKAYRAISHSWSNTPFDETFSLEGFITAISKDLERVLKELRRKDEQTELWIDRFCINQENNAEKAAQVNMMRDIYTNAMEVVIWLGFDDDTSTIALDLVENLSQIDFDRTDVDFDYFMPHAWYPLSKLLQRRWWTRVFTVQEVVMSKSAKVLCGSRFVDFRHFHYLAREAAKRVRSGARVAAQVNLLIYAESDDLALQSQMWELKKKQEPVSLLSLLVNSVSKKAENQRDKVFAFLGLAAEKDRNFMLPDYDKTVSQVMLETTKYLVGSVPYLDILQVRDLRCNAHDLPSWCVDWSAPFNELGRRPRIDGELCYNPENTWSDDLSILYAKGLRFERVAYVSVFARAPGAQDDFSRWDPPPSVKSWYNRVRTGQEVKHCYNRKGGRLDAFIRTLIVDQDIQRSDYMNIPAEIPGVNNGLSFAELKRAFEIWFGIAAGVQIGKLIGNTPGVMKIEGVSSDDNDLAMLYRRSATRYLRGRAFIVTDQGYIGLAPANVAENDSVCFLLGASTPVVLREINSHWTWIGASYIHGIMDGNVLRQYDERGGKARTFAIR